MSFYFSKGGILFIHSKLIDDFGGSEGIRDEGMLDYAISTPLQTFDLQDLYPTAISKIARLFLDWSWIILSSKETRESLPRSWIWALI